MNKIMQENLEDLCKPALWRAVAAEFFGTMFLVLLGCGSIDNNSDLSSAVTLQAPSKVVQVALAFGLIYGSMVWIFNHVSGGHFNPAVSVAAMVCRRVSVVRGLFYVIFQCVGGIAGAALLRWFSAQATDVGVTRVSRITEAQAFGVELMITFILVLVVLSATDEKRNDLGGSAPLSIGLAVVAGHLFAYSYTMASMNSARTFGPAVVANRWENHWVYWVGPIVGGVLAALVYEYIFAAGASFSRTKKFVLKHRRPVEKPKPKDADELNSSKAGLIEAQPNETADDSVAVELEPVATEEEKKEEEPVQIEEQKAE